MKFYLNKYFSQTYSHEIVRRNVKLTRENLNLDSKIKHLGTLAQSIKKKKKTSKSCADDSKASLVWVKKRTEHDLTCPQISFSGHPRHGAVGQNIFPMYISIKRHSWFFKSWWCLLYLAMFRRGRPVNVEVIHHYTLHRLSVQIELPSPGSISKKKVGLPIKIWYDFFQTSVFYYIFKNEIVFCVYFFLISTGFWKHSDFALSW